MCQLTTKVKLKKKVTGYKIAVKIKNEYFSLASGMKYKVGRIKPVIHPKTITNWFRDDVLDVFFEPAMVGRTGVLVNLWHAEKEIGNTLDYCNGYEIVLLIMTISVGLMHGEYDFLPMIAGRNIISMEEIDVK